MLKALVAMANFKIYDVTDWEKNNYNTHFAQYSRLKGNHIMKFCHLVEHNLKFNFSQEIMQKMRPLFVS